MQKLEHRWWCITKECKHYVSFRCSHEDITKVTGKKLLRIKNLIMCPVLARAETCARKLKK